MNKAFELILKRLEESYINCFKSGDYKFNNGIDKAKQIVQEVAEEYNITNGDKIRSMSDEELAEWFETVTDDVMQGSCWNKEGWIKWIQSEAE